MAQRAADPPPRPARRSPREAFAEAVSICLARRTLGRTLRIAAVVGLVLTGINEGDALAHGDFSAATGVKIGLNFVVPFVVSNLGVLAARAR